MVKRGVGEVGGGLVSEDDDRQLEKIAVDGEISRRAGRGGENGDRDGDGDKDRVLGVGFFLTEALVRAMFFGKK